MNIDLAADGESDSVSARVAECIADAVHHRYPEQEVHVPLQQRRGTIPNGIGEDIEEQQQKAKSKANRKHHVLYSTKNATPGDAPQDVNSVLEDIRPKAFTLDLKPSDCTTPDLERSGVYQRYGELHIQTGNKLQSQWESKYLSKALPFCFPRMASGPDFNPDKKWRRLPDSASVTPMEFNRGMARRVEGRIRNHSVCLPIIGRVCYDTNGQWSTQARCWFLILDREIGQGVSLPRRWLKLHKRCMSHYGKVLGVLCSMLFAISSVSVVLVPYVIAMSGYDERVDIIVSHP